VIVGVAVVDAVESGEPALLNIKGVAAGSARSVVRFLILEILLTHFKLLVKQINKWLMTLETFYCKEMMGFTPQDTDGLTNNFS
jgi:hypothetical protein